MKQERSLSIPIDLIRTIAIIGVILLHATNDLTIQHLNQLEIIRWCTVDVYQSFGRMGAPLFVLVTGALLLQPSKDESISVFFKKRWARIGLPFIFWGAAYFLWDFFVLQHAITWDAIIQGILKGPYYQFWYLYMLVGLYLLTPILRIVIAHAERKILRYFVVIWFLGASIAPFVALVTSYSLDGNVLTLTGWVGYFVLGTYLLGVRMRRSTLWALLIVSLALTAIGTYWLAATIGGGTMFFFQEYFSPTMIIASVTFFLLLNTIQSPTSQKEANMLLDSEKRRIAGVRDGGPQVPRLTLHPANAIFLRITEGTFRQPAPLRLPGTPAQGRIPELLVAWRGAAWRELASERAFGSRSDPNLSVAPRMRPLLWLADGREDASAEGRRGRAGVRRLGHRAANHVIERRWHLGSPFAHRWWHGIDLGPHLGHPALLVRERGLAHQHLEQHAAEAVDVAARIWLTAFDLFGRDVVDCSEHLVHCCQAWIRLRALRESEVGEVDVIFRCEDHVGRLDVTVNESLLVGQLQRRGDLGSGSRCSPGLHRTVAVDQRAQLCALDPPRDDIDGSIPLARLIQRDDVGVIERGDRSGLAAKPLPHHRVARQVGLDQLQCYGPVEPKLASPVQNPDPAEADDALDLVSGKCGPRLEHSVRARAQRSGQPRMPARPGEHASRSLAAARRRASRTEP